MLGAEELDEPGTGNKFCDRLAAQKSRAQARQGQFQNIRKIENCGIAPSVRGKPDEETPRLMRKKQFGNAHRSEIDLLYCNVADVTKKPILHDRNSHGNAVVVVTSEDALSQLVKDTAMVGGGHMLRGDDLEARRRAVPGLCPSEPPSPSHQCRKGPPAKVQCSVGSGYHANSEGVTHGMPSQGRGGSNLWAKGNAGNMVTDRPTSRVIKPPGGGSSFRIGKW